MSKWLDKLEESENGYRNLAVIMVVILIAVCIAVATLSIIRERKKINKIDEIAQEIALEHSIEDYRISYVIDEKNVYYLHLYYKKEDTKYCITYVIDIENDNWVKVNEK